MTRWRKNLRVVSLISAAITGLSMPLWFFLGERQPSADPSAVARAFFRASYARDFGVSYAYISALDRQVRDQASYVYDQGSFSGFALELAKKFAERVEFHVIERETSAKRARLTLDYRVPAADELSSLLFNWNPNKLNALSSAGQRRIIDALEKIEKTENMIAIEGQAKFNLIKEDGQWRIFLDWAGATNVSFHAALPVNNVLEVEFVKRAIFANKNEPFESNLKIRNLGGREIVARIEHRIEPKEFADQITMIACGFLRPLTLHPGEEREVSSAYLLDPEFPRNRKLSIAYQFSLETPPRRLR